MWWWKWWIDDDDDYDDGRELDISDGENDSI